MKYARTSTFLALLLVVSVTFKIYNDGKKITVKNFQWEKTTLFKAIITPGHIGHASENYKYDKRQGMKFDVMNVYFNGSRTDSQMVSGLWIACDQQPKQQHNMQEKQQRLQQKTAREKRRIVFKNFDHNMKFDQNATAAQFMTTYEKQCLQRNVRKERKSGHLKLCPCIPKTLNGRHIVNKTTPTLSEIIDENPSVLRGGYWTPRDCYPRDRVAIVIPFRNREPHLMVLLKYLNQLLQRQKIEYRVFVVEQFEPWLFNKASLMNIGFLEARKVYNFDCVIFHDVDMIPEDDRNFYSCFHSPKHVGTYVNKWHYSIFYDGLIGGAFLFKPEEFIQVNGYSNRFYGWGGEDDDLTKRICHTDLKVFRYPPSVNRYTMINHDFDAKNPINEIRLFLLDMHPNEYKSDGLNSVQYNTISYVERRLFTHIMVEIPRPLYISVD